MLHFFFYFLLTAATCHASVSFLTSNGSLVNLTSSSFFQHRDSYYDVQGTMVELSLVRSKSGQGCSFQIPGSLLNSSSFPALTDPRIFYLDFENSLCKFSCLSETFPLALEFSQYLANHAVGVGSKIYTFLVLRKTPVEKADPGNPFYNITCRNVSLPNNDPPAQLHFQLVDLSNPKETLSWFRQNSQLVVRVIQEQGVWNKVFFSWPFMITSISLQVLLVLMAVWSLYQYYVAFLDNTVTFNTKNVVFCISFVACIVTIYRTMLKQFTRDYTLYIFIQELLLTMAFYLLLFLWSHLLQKMSRSKVALVLVGINVVGGIISVFIIGYRIAFNQGYVFNASLRSILVNQVWVSVQGITAAAFLCFVVFFARKAEIVREIGPETMDVLKFLQWLALVGFVSSFIGAFFDSALNNNLKYYARWYAVQKVVHIILDGVTIFSMLLIIHHRPKVTRDASWLEQKIDLIRCNRFASR